MDPRLLRHYEAELSFMRGMGAEFAEAYPKIAGRLGVDGFEVLDPYVERLLEGVAFLNARIQLELELQHPQFTAHLLEVVCPHYLGPTPSMMVAELVPDPGSAALDAGAPLPRGTVLRSRPVEGAGAACVFRTAHDVTLWPLTIAEAERIEGRGGLVAAGVAGPAEARSGVRLRLRREGGRPLSELPLDRLTLFLGGRGPAGLRLHDLLATGTCAVIARSTDRRVDWSLPLAGVPQTRGLAPEEALLPRPRRSFDGYRLLQEYFAMPERLAFLDLAGLAPALARCEGPELDVYLLLRTTETGAAAGLDAGAFRLGCVPAVNLFERRCDRVPVTPSEVEHRVVVDRTAPLDYEVHSVGTVLGIVGEGEEDVHFRSFYSADEFTPAAGGGGAYWSQTRRLRQRSGRERLRGGRTGYAGSETYLSLVDARHAPYPAGLRQLAVTAWVTNRDLPLLLATGAPDLFHLPDGGPVASVRTPVPPTRPWPSLAHGAEAWRLIGHLSLNYLSIADAGQGGGVAALRELVGLYAPEGDRAARRQVEGIAAVASRPVVRPMADGALSTAVRGLEIALTLDEELFEGGSAFLLGAVLERFLRSYASINAFTETVLSTTQRGEIARWRPAEGLRAAI